MSRSARKKLIFDDEAECVDVDIVETDAEENDNIAIHSDVAVESKQPLHELFAYDGKANKTK